MHQRAHVQHLSDRRRLVPLDSEHEPPRCRRQTRVAAIPRVHRAQILVRVLQLQPLDPARALTERATSDREAHAGQVAPVRAAKNGSRIMCRDKSVQAALEHRHQFIDVRQRA